MLKPPDLAKICFELLKQKKLRVAFAESCTGGLLTQLMSRIPGASEVLMGGVVTYADAWKTQFVDVDPALIQKHGAVSAEVVKAMAEGLQKKTGVDLSVSISGIAGPSGGSAEKPVGTVWIGLKVGERAVQAQRFHFYGGRVAIQRRASQAALFLIQQLLSTGET